MREIHMSVPKNEIRTIIRTAVGDAMCYPCWRAKSGLMLTCNVPIPGLDRAGQTGSVTSPYGVRWFYHS
jgi:hypothetical protein